MKIGRLAGQIDHALRAEYRRLQRSWAHGLPVPRIICHMLAGLIYRTRRALGLSRERMHKSAPHLNIAFIGPRPDLLAETRHTRIDRLPLGWITPAQHDALMVTSPADGRAPAAMLARINRYQQAGKPVVILLPPGNDADALLAVLDAPPTLICPVQSQMAQSLRDKGIDDDRLLILPPAINPQRTSPIGFPLHGAQELGIIHHGSMPAPDYGPDAPAAAALKWSDPADLPRLAHQARKLRAVICDPASCPCPATFAQQVVDLAGAGAVILYPAAAAAQLAGLIGADNGLPFSTAADLHQISDKLADPVLREQASITARRHVHQHHSQRNRLDALLTALRIPTRQSPLVSIIACTMRPNFLPRFLAMIAAQDWPHLELVLIAHGDNFDAQELSCLLADLAIPTTIIKCPQSMIFGACLNKGMFAARGQYITKMDDDDFYGPSHIRDLVQAHDYSNAEATGKPARFIYLAGQDKLISGKASGEAMTIHVSGAAFMLRQHLARDYMILPVARAEDRTLFERLTADRHVLYETHGFGFCVYRGTTGHTWQKDDATFLADAHRQWDGLNPALTGIGVAHGQNSHNHSAQPESHGVK